MLRSNRRANLAVLAALALGAASCTGQPAAPPWTPEAVTPRQLADFCAAAVPAYCGHLARCRPEAAAEPYEDCLTGQGAAWCASLLTARRVAEVGSGRLRWEPYRAGRCVQDLAAPACRTFGPGQSCAASVLLTGRVAGGEACLGDDPDGLECARGTCLLTGPCAGTCPVVGGAGAACYVDAQCAPGLGCVEATGGHCGSDACACQPRLLEGDDCSVAAGAPACQPGLTCQLGRCERARSGPGPASALPDPFSGDTHCDGALTLVYQGSGPSCVDRSRGGERCRDIGDCEAGLTCRKGGRCGPFLAEPGPCEPPSLEGGDCALGWTCGTAGCQPRATGMGEACLSCFGRGLTCAWDGVGFSCQAPAPLGAPCEVLMPCADPLWCDLDCATPPCLGTCRERLPAGSTCSSAGACASGACDLGICADLCALP